MKYVPGRKYEVTLGKKKGRVGGLREFRGFLSVFRDSSQFPKTRQFPQGQASRSKRLCKRDL